MANYEPDIEIEISLNPLAIPMAIVFAMFFLAGAVVALVVL